VAENFASGFVFYTDGGSRNRERKQLRTGSTCRSLASVERAGKRQPSNTRPAESHRCWPPRRRPAGRHENRVWRELA